MRVFLDTLLYFTPINIVSWYSLVYLGTVKEQETTKNCFKKRVFLVYHKMNFFVVLSSFHHFNVLASLKGPAVLRNIRCYTIKQF